MTIHPGRQLILRRWARRAWAAGLALVYGATNVVFCHAAESNFWSSRRTAARLVSKQRPDPLSASTDALILAQLPGGARLDFRGPLESSVVPAVPPHEQGVGGKIPVFESDLPRWLADVVTPYGNMRDVYLSKRAGAPLVIQIQDLHDSTEAQRNIAGLVESLHDQRGVSLVGLEGAQGAFATADFRSFPDADITKSVAEHFMDQGYLGGPEFAGITAKRIPLLWGVEDINAYNANVAAVNGAAKNRPEVDRFLQECRRVMREVKERRLSVPLLEFDRHLTDYHLGKEPLGVYVRYLLKSSPLSTPSVPNLILLRDALRWEETLDFKRIEREREKLLERMARGLSKENMDRLVARSAAYRLGRVTYGDYYRFLRALCKDSGIDLDEYGPLNAYVRYVLLAERINRNDLLTELSALERAVQDGWAVSAEEKRIVSSARNLALLERLVRHAYTPDDWAYHVLHSEEIRNVGRAVVGLALQAGVPHTLSPPTSDVLKPFEDFCQHAVGRNLAMVQNLLEKMHTEKRPTAVLVAGGFHTEGLTQLLRQKDISYVVVTPKVNGSLPDGNRTLELLARDPAPLEKLFAGETMNIPLPRITNGQNIRQSKLASRLATLFVVLNLGLNVAGKDVEMSSTGIVPAVARSQGGGEESIVRVGNGEDQRRFRVRVVPESDSPLSPQVFRARIPSYGDVVVRPEPNIRSWRPGILAKRVSPFGRSLAAALSRGVSGLKNLSRFLAEQKAGMGGVALLTFSVQALAADSVPTSLSILWPPLVLLLSVIGVVAIGRYLFKNVGKRILLGWDSTFGGVRQNVPLLYYSLTGLLKTASFPVFAYAVIVPSLGTTLGWVWMFPVFWLMFPFGRALKKDFSWRLFVQEIRTEERYAQRYRARSRLLDVVLLSGTFIVAHHFIGLYSALALASFVSAFWDLLRPRSVPHEGDPFKPSWAGYLWLIWLLLSVPASYITIASGDGDDFSSLNNVLGKDLVGTAPGGIRSEKIIFPKVVHRSLFWELRQALANLAVQITHVRVIRGVGGDEYMIFMKGNRHEAQQGLSELVKQFNAVGLISENETGHPKSFLDTGDGRYRPRELFLSFPKDLRPAQIIELRKMPFSLSLVDHAGRYKLSVDRTKTSLSVPEIIEFIESKLRLEPHTIKELQWGSPDGVSVFTTSIGAVNVEDVIRTLVLAGNMTRVQSVPSPQQDELIKSLEKKWIGKSGRVRLLKIPQIILWGLRFANDALKTAKGEPLKGDSSQGGGPSSQGKNRAYFLSNEDVVNIAHSDRVNWEKIEDIRWNWWREMFRFGLSNKDSLSKTLTQAAFHEQLSRENPAFVYRIDMAGYFPSERFFDARAFHVLQGNNYKFGNDVVLAVSSALREMFSEQGMLSRTGPDSYYLASDTRIDSKKMDELIDVIQRNLRQKYPDKVWDPRIAVFEVSRDGFESLNRAREEEKASVFPWPLKALTFLDTLSETVKTHGERFRLENIGLGQFSEFVHSEKAVRVTFPETLLDQEQFEKKFEEAQQLKEFEAKTNLGISSEKKPNARDIETSSEQGAEGKSGNLFAGLRGKAAALLLGVFVPVGLLLLLITGHPSFLPELLDWVQVLWRHSQEWLGVGLLVGSTATGLNKSDLEEAVSTEPRALAHEKEFNRLLTELTQEGGSRLRKFQLLSEIRFLPPARGASQQVQLYMNHLLRQMVLPEGAEERGGELSPGDRVSDEALFRLVFLDKWVALEKRLIKKRTHSPLSASDRLLARTAAMVFVPLASRLGWHSMADEIAEMSFELLEPTFHSAILSDLRESLKFSGLEEMDRHAALLEENLTSATTRLLGEKSKFHVRVRRKRLYSIAAKIKNKPEKYRSARDIHDSFNVVVVFDKAGKGRDWKATQGLLYNQYYATLEAHPIQGYKDGRDPKDSYEPKGKEDVHVLFDTFHGFVEVQFKSPKSYAEYKSRGSVTERRKSPPHWVYKTKMILQALYGDKSLNLEADDFDLTHDVAQNLEEVVRRLLPFSFPLLVDWSKSEARVIPLPVSSRVLSLVAHPELKIALEEVSTTSLQRFDRTQGGAFPGNLDRRSLDPMGIVKSPDVLFIQGHSKKEMGPSPAQNLSLRARLGMLSADDRREAFQTALSQLRGVVSGTHFGSGPFEKLLSFFLPFGQSNHRYDAFEISAKAIARERGLSSIEELYMVWGAGLLSSGDLGQDIYRQGRQRLAEHNKDLKSGGVLDAFREMLAESPEIGGLLRGLPPILGKCADMLAEKNVDGLGSKDLYLLVLAVALGTVPMDRLERNFPSVSLTEKSMGGVHLFTLRGGDRVGFILQIIRLLNASGAPLISIDSPGATSSGNEIEIHVKTQIDDLATYTKVKEALSSLAAAESGPSLSSNAMAYRLTILHEDGIKPLLVVFELLAAFDANVTRVPPATGEGERTVEFQLNPDDRAALESALEKSQVAVESQVVFDVRPIHGEKKGALRPELKKKSNGPDQEFLFPGVFALSFMDPTGMGGGLLSAASLIVFLMYGRDLVPSSPLLAKQILGVFALFFLFTGAALGAESLGAMSALFSWEGGGLPLLSLSIGAVMGIQREDPSAEFAVKGGSNKVNRIEFGVAMHFTSLASNGDVVPFVSYSLRNPGDRGDQVKRRVLAEKERVRAVMGKLHLPKGFGPYALLTPILRKVQMNEVNAQTAVVEALDELASGSSATDQVVIREVKDELLRNLMDTHSLSHLGYAAEELAQIKRKEIDRMSKAVDKVETLVKSRGDSLGGDSEAVQAVIDGISADVALLKDLRQIVSMSIEEKNTTALGALIEVLRGFEAVLSNPGETHEEKTKEYLIQAIDNVMAVIEEIQERLSPVQIGPELSRADEAFRRARLVLSQKERRFLASLERDVIASIRAGWKGESAVHRAGHSVPEPVMRAVLDELTAPPRESNERNVVVFSKTVLTPNDLIRLRQRGLRVVGVVCAEGNRGSHAAIVAQSLGIPFVTGALVDGRSPGAWSTRIPAGTFVGVDGAAGVIWPDPTAARLEDLKNQQEKILISEAVYKKEESKKTPLSVLASPDDSKEMAHVKDPVGLIRTEYLFNHPTLSPLVNDHPNKPFEEYLVAELESASRRLNGPEMDVRVIDNQGQEDKPLSGVPQKPGGATGIEFLLRDPVGRAIALQELRAIIRAYQTHRGIRMFFPLVSTLDDAADIEKLLDEAVRSLPPSEKGGWDLPPLGYMIETPGGVMNAKSFAQRVKFFSIGSTDLTRSTFNKSRNDSSLDRDLAVNRPEVVRQIRNVMLAAKSAKIDVNICGALASSRVFWPVALALRQSYPVGLSLPPPLIPEAKYYLRRIARKELDLKKLRALIENPRTTSEELTAASQKIIDAIETEISMEPSYRSAMEDLRKKKQSETLASFRFLAAFLVVLAGCPFLLFPANVFAGVLSMTSAASGWGEMAFYVLSGAAAVVFGGARLRGRETPFFHRRRAPAAEHVFYPETPWSSLHGKGQDAALSVLSLNPFSLFGKDLLTPLVLAASGNSQAGESAKKALLKLGSEGAMLRAASDVVVSSSGLFQLTGREILAVIRAAGYAVLPESPFKETMAAVLKEIHLHRASGIPQFIHRVHVLRAENVLSPEGEENEFAFFVRDAKGFLNIYIHEKTLEEWVRKGTAKGERGRLYFRSALAILFYHEWAESFGVSHEQLRTMGLTMEGLDALYTSGLSEEEIQWEIRARGMLVLGMVVPDLRVLNVQARTDAGRALETLLPSNLPRDVQSYVTGGLWQIHADRGTWAQRTAFQLRSSLPGLGQDTYAQAIRGVPGPRYKDLLDLVREDSERFENALRKETSALVFEENNIQDGLARDILARVFQMLRSGDWGNFEVSGPTLLFLKRELAVLHATGGSLFLSLSGVDASERVVSPGDRLRFQERDLAWLDQLPILHNHLSSVSPEQIAAIQSTSDGYRQGSALAQRLVGVFAALDESLYKESTTSVLRISENMLVGTGDLSGEERTALRGVTALARRAEKDSKMASRVVFLADHVGGRTLTTSDLLNKLERRLKVTPGDLMSLGSAHVLDNENLFESTVENNRLLRTYKAAKLFESLNKIGISSQRVDIYSVPPTDSLAEVWDITGLRNGLVLQLIEMWAGDVAVRVSSEFGEAFTKRMQAIKTAA